MPEVSRSKITIDVPLQATQEKRICAECGNDYSSGGWHWGEDATKLYCEYCWRNTLPSVDVQMGRWERKLEDGLPKGSILGPKDKATGMRGVYRLNRYGPKK